MSRPDPASFTFEPLFLLLALALAVAYVRAMPRHGRRPGRIVVFAIGLLCLCAPLNSPLETIARHYLLLAHLLQNALTADWAPPLLLLGLTPEMRAALVARGGERLLRVTQPFVTLPVWLLAWYGVHAVPFYEFALNHPSALNLEHAILISAGTLFWWPVLTDRLSSPGALLYLFTAFVTSAFLGLALTFLPPFYPFYEQAPRIWGLSAKEDQNLGGVLMNAEQSVVFIAAMAYRFFRLLGDEREEGHDLGLEVEPPSLS